MMQRDIIADEITGIRCENCIHLRIYEDNSEDIRHPFGTCTLGFEIEKIAVMEWKPSNICKKFVFGEPTFC